MFKHALTHDVAYETLLRGKRRELHRRRLRLVPASGRPRRLRIDGNDVVPRSDKRIECGHRERRRAQKSEAQLQAFSRSALLRAFASFLSIISRFSRDR